VHCDVSFDTQKGTLRGLHDQVAPYPEANVVRCTRGTIYDVVVDLRPRSCTFKNWISAILTSENRTSIYVPEGCAPDFLTLEDQSEVYYQMSEVYNAESARGVRWDDPSFRIAWPAKVEVISERDRTYPNFS
jgi:dTDP-4-dehydrorhamnose 3,5-epimerase